MNHEFDALGYVTWYYPWRDPVVCRRSGYGWYKFFAYNGYEFILN